MAFTSVLAILEGGEGDEPLLDATLRLAREQELFVQLIAVRPGPDQAVPIMADGLSGGAIGEIIEAMEESGRARVEAAEAVYRRCCVEPSLPLAESDDGEPGFRIAFEVVEGLLEDVVAERGRRCDLVAVARPVAAEERIYAPALEAALFSTGRPVLVVPPNHCDSLTSHVAVAWNDTREAARALLAALPFLKRAEAVELLAVEDGGCDADPAALSGYLRRHGVTAEFRKLQPDYRPLGEQMLEEAKKGGADLFVMGAYGHSRLRELVLGGVTRQVLATADMPLLMVH